MHTKTSFAALCTAAALLGGCGADATTVGAGVQEGSPAPTTALTMAPTAVATAPLTTAPATTAPATTHPTTTPPVSAPAGPAHSRPTSVVHAQTAATVRTGSVPAAAADTARTSTSRTTTRTMKAVSPPAPPAAVPAPVYSIAPTFFGVHDASPTGVNGWPQTTIGSIRLWDAGVTWREIEKTPGKFDFTRLDAIIRQANLKRAQTLIVLGQTPRFYASKVRSSDVYGPGAASMPANLNAWKRYVAAVASRPGVKGNGSVQFQVWNEANVAEFWSGTPAQMALLTSVTRSALGGSRFLVAPALVTRNSAQRTWMDLFYASKVNKRPVADYVNAVSLHLYPLPNGRPEDSISILALDKKILAKYRVTKPIWNTEVNYGLAGRPAAPLTASLQAGNVARTYLLNAAAGIARTYWYAWGPIALANTRTTTGNGYSLTMAGKAYGVTRSWLVDSTIRGCVTSAQGTYTCTITYRGGVRRVFWNPTRSVSVAVAGATSHQLVDGTLSTYRPRTIRLTVGPAPVMVRSAG